MNAHSVSTARMTCCWAWAAGALVVLVPGVNNQMTAPLNDVALALWTTLAMAAWWRAVIGGELSGHIFFNDPPFEFDDALYAGALLLFVGGMYLGTDGEADEIQQSCMQRTVTVKLGEIGIGSPAGWNSWKGPANQGDDLFQQSARAKVFPVKQQDTADERLHGAKDIQ